MLVGKEVGGHWTPTPCGAVDYRRSVNGHHSTRPEGPGRPIAADHRGWAEGWDGWREGVPALSPPLSAQLSSAAVDSAAISPAAQRQCGLSFQP